MKNIGKTTILLALFVGGGMWLARGGGEVDGAGSKHLVNQLWVERWPDGHRDIFGKFMVLDTDHGRFGVVGKSSNWRHFYEGFMWSKEGDELSMAFPQEGHRARFKVRTWKCAGETQGPFDLCLEIRRGDRSALFYSKEEWEVRPGDAESDLGAIAADNPWLGHLEAPVGLQAVEVEGLLEASGDWTPFD